MAPARTLTIDAMARIDLTPVVGVLLALLTMVMITTPVVNTAWEMDQSPLNGMYGDGPAWDPVFVTVGATGGLMIGGAAASQETLARDVCAAQYDARGSECHRRPIFIRGDTEARYADILSTMQALKAAGFKVAFLHEDIE